MPPKIGKSEITDDRQIVAADGWAIATDGHQWILQRLRGERWVGVMFVRSTKTILAQCMKEKGVPAHTAKQLLAAIEDQFDPHQDRRETPLEACSSDLNLSDGVGHHPASLGLTGPSSACLGY